MKVLCSRLKKNVPPHRLCVERLSVAHWADKRIVCGGRVYDNLELPGFMARLDGKPAGFLTYHRKGKVMDLVSIACRPRRRGAGAALLKALVRQARREGCWSVRVATTRENMDALCFYQAMGFSLSGVRRGALHRARRIKPSIPRVGNHGIPLEHERHLRIS